MDSPRKPDFERLLVELTRVLDAAGIQFMVVGGQAVLLHGVPRTTEDIDISLGVDTSRLREVVSACADLGLDLLPDDPEAFARETFVLPTADPDSLVRIDFIFSSLDYEREAIGRAVRVQLGDRDVPFISVEDLILHKLFAGRARDREDVDGILALRPPALDWAYLEHWATEFASIPGREDLPGIVQDLRSRHRQ